MLITVLFWESIFWFDGYSKLERAVAPLSLLEYHLVIQNRNTRSLIQMVRPSKGYSNINSYHQLVPVNKMTQVPAPVREQVTLVDIRCGRSYLGQELAVVGVSETELN